MTGSLIPKAEEVTATPVDTLGRREIDLSGSVQMLEILMKREADIIGAGNLGPSNVRKDLADGTQGGSAVSIRGLPTLVLFEGRRIADSAAISISGSQFADVNVFPSSLVSRIEVLKDGASALYGSDAVGGVINIFLKHDYRGAEAGYRYGFTPTSGTQNTLVWILAGSGNEKTHVTVGYQYYQTSGLFARERPYSYSPNPVLDETTTPTYAGRIDDAGGREYILQAGLNSPFNVPGVGPATIAFPGTTDPPFTGLGFTAYGPPQSDAAIRAQYNLANRATSYLAENNQSATASFTHKLFSKRLELFGGLLWTNNHNQIFLNGQPISGGSLTLLPGPFNPFIDAASGLPVAFVPPGTPLGVQFAQFNVSSDNLHQSYANYPRTITNDTQFIRLLGGLRSQITNDYNFETAFYYSKYQLTFRQGGLVNGNQLNAILNGTGLDFSGNPIPRFDFFARNPVGRGAGQISAAQFSTIFGTTIRDEESWQKVIDAKFTGFPFKLPAGPFGFAIGGEYRSEGFSVTGSPAIFIESVPSKAFRGSRSILSAFIELAIPLVGPQMKIPAIYGMDVSMAGRHEHIESLNANSNVPKVTFRYQPVQDLTVRASFSNSFVAPNLYQLYGPSQSGLLPSSSFPLSPTGPSGPEGVAHLRSGSNPNLAPSTAQNWGAGVVYSPKSVSGLTVSVDYFNVLQKNSVGAPIPLEVLSSVNSQGAGSLYYDRVHVGAFDGPLIPRTYGPNNNGSYYVANNIENMYVDASNINVGSTRTTGWDFSISYIWDLRRFGTVQLGANAVLYVNNDFRESIDSPVRNVKRTSLPEGGGTNPAYQVNMLAEYRFQGWKLGFTGRYIPAVYAIGPPSLFADFQNLRPKVPDYFQTDSSLSYSFAAPNSIVSARGVGEPKGDPARAVVASPSRWFHGVTLTVGCNNLFNQQPPFVDRRTNNTDLSTYDPFGRLVYVQASKKF
ncbi:hypothetical protein AYO41_00855 [Verrucomicrobia bacterium SCGC AG-212-E04]|nr:hypothetical protein AYO41_00855 [Verrucomicrobia bacterium SCGC AG-212-E04]